MTLCDMNGFVPSILTYGTTKHRAAFIDTLIYSAMGMGQPIQIEHIEKIYMSLNNPSLTGENVCQKYHTLVSSYTDCYKRTAHTNIYDWKRFYTSTICEINKTAVSTDVFNAINEFNTELSKKLQTFTSKTIFYSTYRYCCNHNTLQINTERHADYISDTNVVAYIRNISRFVRTIALRSARKYTPTRNSNGEINMVEPPIPTAKQTNEYKTFVTVHCMKPELNQQLFQMILDQNYPKIFTTTKTTYDKLTCLSGIIELKGTGTLYTDVNTILTNANITSDNIAEVEQQLIDKKLSSIYTVLTYTNIINRIDIICKVADDDDLYRKSIADILNIDMGIYQDELFIGDWDDRDRVIDFSPMHFFLIYHQKI